ncbi:MAG: flavin reductase [Cryobacterium sp.]|nr:flavin reductase [Cryobacterium sp.]
MASRVQKGFEPGSRLYQPPQLHLRGSFSRFATGVAVVSFEASSGRHAITVNSFTSVSMEPPLVLVSIAKSAKTHDELFDKPFTVNILGAEQEDVARHFSGRPNQEPKWVEEETAPRLSGVLAWFCCTPWANYEGGDHTLFLGEVQEFDYRRGDALGFVGGRFVTIPDYLAGHEALI